MDFLSLKSWTPNSNNNNNLSNSNSNSSNHKINNKIALVKIV